MKKWIVPAIISAMALSLFAMATALPLSPRQYESALLPPEQKKAIIRLAQLPGLLAFNLVPGINFAFLYGVLYHQVATNTEQGTTARTEAGHTAQTETFIGLLLWLAVFGVVVLLKPKWWYLAVAFALTIGGALWISTL